MADNIIPDTSTVPYTAGKSDEKQGTSPSQPSQPPKAETPSPAHQSVTDTNFDGWNKHGNYSSPQQALQDKHTNKEINPSSFKR